MNLASLVPALLPGHSKSANLLLRFRWPGAATSGPGTGEARRTREIEPREIPWDTPLDQCSVPADLFTLNYRRAFRELMKLVPAQAPATVDGRAAALAVTRR